MRWRSSITCSWHWVTAHAGDPGNERADALANRGVPLTAIRIGSDTLSGQTLKCVMAETT